MKNNYLYQGPYSELDEDIGWNDFALRNYDPQTGRWVQQDPFQQFASPYVGMGNDPINNTDPSGGVVIPIDDVITLQGVVVSASYRTIKAAQHTLTTISKVSLTIKTALFVTSVINIRVNTRQVGDGLAAARLRGFKDAWWNAVFLGAPDAMSGTNLDDYKDPYEQEAYLQGRLWGDAAAIAVGVATSATSAKAAGRSAITPGGQVVTAGAAAVSVYSAGVAAVAAADAAWATAKLLRIEESPGYWDNHPDNKITQHESNWFKKERLREKNDLDLPTLDGTGKVHGTLPKSKDFDKYSKNRLKKLLEDLKKSVQVRIKLNSELGPKGGHAARQAAEQSLIKSLEKYLGK